MTSPWFTGTVDDIDYSLYPSRDEQLPWLRAYLQEKAVLAGRSADDVSESDVDKYYVWANNFALVSKWLWT